MPVEFSKGKTLRKYVSGDEERFQTTQHERDEETGLDYRGARYYDADIARFLSPDPKATDFAAWSTYNYVLGNPMTFIDPDGKAPETKFVDRRGKVLVDIDDGSNEVFVIEYSNKKNFYNELIGSVNADFDILDSENNKALGEKYGFNLNDIEDNSCPECSYTSRDDPMHSAYRAGYAHGYADKMANHLILGDKALGTAHLYGYSHGEADREAGYMNTFDPKLKDNTPFLEFNYSENTKELSINIFGREGTVEDLVKWVDKLFNK